jgi:hypothetical protein
MSELATVTGITARFLMATGVKERKIVTKGIR